jgi:hypothetical protein
MRSERRLEKAKKHRAENPARIAGVTIPEKEIYEYQ